MILIDRALSGVFLGIALFGAAAVTIAQGVLDENAITIERILGGGILITVAILIVRWSRQISRDATDTLGRALGQTQTTLDATVAILEAEREAWKTERAEIRDERNHLRQQLIETQNLLTEERNLRVSLEQAGLVDRRKSPDTD